jgi:hypothetical protein
VSTSSRRPAAAAYTVAVLVAAAAATDDVEWLRRYADRCFEFRLLAAADRLEPEPPAQGWHDLRRLLRMEAVVAAGEVRLSVQAEGYAALQRVAGRAARLRSPDGVIDLRCGFDGAGRAIAVLADSEAVRKTLQHLFLTLEEPHNELPDGAT